MSFEAYWKRLDEMPEDLRKIVLANYDYTGRPISQRSYSNTIIEVLKKNSSTGGESFINDMKIIFPEMVTDDVAIYYNVFISGAKHLAENLSKK